MEKIIFPLKYMKQTQGVNGGYSHQGILAIDYGHNNGVAEKLYAPFTGTIKKIYGDVNIIWFESNEQVQFADGSVDHCVVISMHDDDVSDLYVGRVFQQGEPYSQQGNAGNSTGTHTHIEVTKGKFTGSGWYKNSVGNWVMNNPHHPENTFYIPDDVTIVNDGGYNWRKLEPDKELIGGSVGRNEYAPQLHIKVSNLNARDSANGNVLGYANMGTYFILNSIVAGDYTWYEINPGVWVAYNVDWADLLPTLELPEYMIKQETSTEEYKKLKEENKNLTAINETLLKENEKAQEDVEELETQLEEFNNLKRFVAAEKGKYYVNLEKNDILYKE